MSVEPVSTREAISFRRGTAEEAREIARLVRHHASAGRSSAPSTPDAWTEWLHAPGTRVDLAEYQGRLIGCSCVRPCDGGSSVSTRREAELAAFVVAAGWRGRGVARRLMVRTLRSAKRLSASSLWIESENVDEATRAFVEKCGFELVAEGDAGLDAPARWRRAIGRGEVEPGRFSDWDVRYGRLPAAFGDPYPGLVAFLETLPLGTALDLGCGQGRDAVALAERGWHVDAVDPSEVAIDQLRQRARRAGLPIAPRVSSLERLEIDRPYDLVLLDMVLHFITDDDFKTTLLNRCLNALRPAGHLAIVTPGPDRDHQRLLDLTHDHEGVQIVEDTPVDHALEGEKFQFHLTATAATLGVPWQFAGALRVPWQFARQARTAVCGGT